MNLGSTPAANIGPRGIQARFYSGLLFTLAALVLAGYVVSQGSDWLLRLPIIPLFWLGLLGLNAAAYKT